MGAKRFYGEPASSLRCSKKKKKLVHGIVVRGGYSQFLSKAALMETFTFEITCNRLVLNHSCEKSTKNRNVNVEVLEERP